MEDAEIIKAIRSMKMGSHEMLTFWMGFRKEPLRCSLMREGNLSMDNQETGNSKKEKV